MRQYVNFRKEPSPQRGTAKGWEKQQEDYTIREHLLPFDVEPTLADWDRFGTKVEVRRRGYCGGQPIHVKVDLVPRTNVIRHGNRKARVRTEAPTHRAKQVSTR
jgi:hypothetical protein